MNTYLQNRRGVSITEVIIVIAISGMLTVLTLLSFSSLKDSQAVINAEDAVAALIIQARTQTLSSFNDTRYGIHFSSGPLVQSSQVVMYSGATYTAGAVGNVVINLSDNAKIVSVSLNGGGTDLLFNRLTGGTDQYGDVILEITPAQQVHTKTITINKAGAVIIK